MLENFQNKVVLPTLRGVLGDWVFYSTLMSAEQIHNVIQPAKNIRESISLDEILQRDLKDRRKAIARYLLQNESHFFNSIIAGVFEEVPDWIEFKFSETESHKFNPSQLSNLRESMGFLILSGNEKIFAIDGQHRVAGIQIAYQDQKSKNKIIDDQFSVIFVAHVDDESGRKRTRKLFSDINKNAKPVAEGDKIKIDEEEIDAIVTRRIYANYSHFQEGKIISLTESARLESKDKVNFTNLLGLHSVNKILKKLFIRKKGTKQWDEVNVLSFEEIVKKFYDFSIQNINDYNNYFIKKTLTIPEARLENKYLLYRPIGLKLIAKLYVYFFQKDDLIFLQKHINKINFIFPDSPFNKILWNNGKMEAKSTNQSLALSLALYLLHQEVDQEDLCKKYRDILKNDTVDLPEKIILDI
ncbi:MAG: hypothetical protein B7Y37_04580 [Sphingobacteriia bacterium 28-36-52]|nr:MAG: hypothetical protein B7Y37_04580 [Sphingobacteriia bacterium 28-36-52]